MLDPQQRERIEQILGERIDDAQAGTAASLNRLDEAHIANARRLAEASTVLAVGYLRFLVPAARLADAVAFVEDVVAGGRDPRTWRAGPMLLSLHQAPKRLLQASWASTEAELEGIAGQRWYRIAPESAAGERPPLAGQVGIYVADGDHRIRTRPEVVPVFLKDAIRAEPVVDVVVAYRRWLGHMIAWFLAERRVVSASTPEEIVQVFSTAEPVSVDADVAMRALVREFASGAPSELPYGYRGPDDWYR